MRIPYHLPTISDERDRFAIQAKEKSERASGQSKRCDSLAYEFTIFFEWILFLESRHARVSNQQASNALCESVSVADLFWIGFSVTEQIFLDVSLSCDTHVSLTLINPYLSVTRAEAVGCRLTSRLGQSSSLLEERPKLRSSSFFLSAIETTTSLDIDS